MFTVETFEDNSALITAPAGTKPRAMFRYANKYHDCQWADRAMTIVRAPKRKTIQLVVWPHSRDHEIGRRLKRRGLVR